MPKNKKLQKQIERKLDQLQEIVNQVEDVQSIDPNDPDTWDSDTLYNATAHLKDALKLLENQKSKQLDQFGEPIILEAGLCSLVDEYHEEEEDSEDY